MKIEIGAQKPVNFKEYWPGQYEFFSHFEYVSGVPHGLFLITTIKENGKPNINFHSWSAFTGDSGGYYAVLGGLGMHTHTYANILRSGEFCVNFISSRYYDAALRTIEHNEDETDEFAAGGFTLEAAVTVKVPRIKEAFLCFECTLKSTEDLSGKGITSLVIGRVNHAAVEENNHNIDKVCGADGFMFDVHSPKNPLTGEGKTTALAALNPLRLFEE